MVNHANNAFAARAKLSLIFLSSGILLSTFLLGCKVENPPTREQVKEQKALKKEAPLVTPKVIAPESRNVNEAQLVLDACGAPTNEKVLRERTDEANGPVLYMMYRGEKPVQLQFIPNIPPGRIESEGSPLEPLLPTGQKLPANTTWMFSEARMENEEILTSRRLSVYLPCAAHALNRFE